MKLKAFPLTALVIGLLAASPSALAGSPASEHLSLPDARDAARAAAWVQARQNPSVNSVKLGICHRDSVESVSCEAVTRGSTSTLKTTCHLRIRVRAIGGRAKATLTSVNCGNRRMALLRAHEAEAAMLPWAQQAAGKEVPVDFLGRLSRVEFVGMAFWFRPAAEDPTQTEICKVEMRAALIDTDAIQVHIDNSECQLPIH